MRRPAGVRVRGSLGRTQLPRLILILSLLQLAATAGSHASGSSAADENQHGRNGIAGRSGGSREAHTRVMPAKESHEMSREAKLIAQPSGQPRALRDARVGPTGTSAEASSPARPEIPQNVSGMYRGTWIKHGHDLHTGSAHPLLKDDGVVIFELRSMDSDVEGMDNVQGDLVVRDGLYVTDNDIRMHLHGVYHKEAGRLEAVLEPLSPIQMDITNADQTEENSDYRSALRNAAGWTLSSLRDPAMHLHTIGRAHTEAAMQKKCEFNLQLRSTVVQQADNDTRAAPPVRETTHADLDAVSPSLATWQEAQPIGVGAEEIVMNGTLFSENCGLTVHIDASYVRLEEYYAKAVNYTVMVTVISFVQVLLLIRQMESTNTQASAAKVSLMSIGIQAIMDAYLCLLHLTAGIVVEALFNAFATAAFFEFIIFAVFEMRYLLAIWRARRSGFSDPISARRELSMLYTRFYGALLLVIFFAYQLQAYLRGVVFILYSFWIPQIVHCVRADVRQPLRPLYVLGISATRLALPLYLFGCPKNMLRIEESPYLCAALVAWVMLQAGVLMLQAHFGPRCFIPKRFLPPKYDYFQEAKPFQSGSGEPGDVESGAEIVECVICMTPVDAGRPAARMVTPCNHFFHSGCLQRWMDVKMECPTCRRILPPP